MPATGPAGIHTVHDGTFTYSVSCDRVWVTRKNTLDSTTLYGNAFAPSALFICQCQPGWDDNCLTEAGRQQLRNLPLAK